MSYQEVRLSLNGKPYKIITLTSMARDWIVEEKESLEELLSGRITWHQTFNQNCPNAEYAQTIYYGRLHMAFHEKNEDAEREEQEKRMYKSVGSTLGRL